MPVLKAGIAVMVIGLIVRATVGLRNAFSSFSRVIEVGHERDEPYAYPNDSYPRI
jgi:hypothetical protein